MQIVSRHETRKFADWSELIPLLLQSRKHLSVEDFSEAVLAVAQAAERKDITAEESKLLLSHLASALLGYELNSIIGALAVDTPSLLGALALAIPLIAGGNTVVLVLSQSSPVPGLALGELFAVSDLPGREPKPFQEALTSYRLIDRQWAACRTPCLIVGFISIGSGHPMTPFGLEYELI